MPTGILFDKDGTLLDFNRTWLAPYRRAAACLQAKFGARADANMLLARGGFIAKTQTWRADSVLASGSNDEIIACWAETIGIPLDKQTRDDIMQCFTLRKSDYAPVLDDLPGFFTELKTTYGCRIGVATMDAEVNAMTMLRAFGATASVDFVCGADSGFGVKPAPGMALAFCRACNLQPGQIAVVGDSPVDMRMARAAGARAIGVLTGAHAAAALTPLADKVIADIGQLPAVLDVM